MIDTQKMIEKVMPEYQEKMIEIEEQRAGIKTSEIGESAEMIAERVKNKISMTEQNTGRINLFEMFMGSTEKLVECVQGFGSSASWG